MNPVRLVRLFWLVPVIAGGLLACCAVAPAASIQYPNHYHADDVFADTDAHEDSYAFGEVTAAIPSPASSTSTLADTGSGFTFVADQSRTGSTYAWVHTLFTILFVPSTDTPFTFAGAYDIHRQSDSADPTVVALYVDMGDATMGDAYIQYEFNGQVFADTTLPFPTPPTSMLLAGHAYYLAVEAFNETYPGDDGGTLANLHLKLAAVPLPRSAFMGAVALALVPLGRRRVGGMPCS